MHKNVNDRTATMPLKKKLKVTIYVGIAREENDKVKGKACKFANRARFII